MGTTYHCFLLLWHHIQVSTWSKQKHVLMLTLNKLYALVSSSSPLFRVFGNSCPFFTFSDLCVPLCLYFSPYQSSIHDAFPDWLEFTLLDWYGCSWSVCSCLLNSLTAEPTTLLFITNKTMLVHDLSANIKQKFENWITWYLTRLNWEILKNRPEYYWIILRRVHKAYAA